jgi:hypothetical protein
MGDGNCTPETSGIPPNTIKRNRGVEIYEEKMGLERIKGTVEAECAKCLRCSHFNFYVRTYIGTGNEDE